MSNKRTDPVVKQKDRKEINAEETREYIDRLLKRIAGREDVATDDAIALASLAASLDKFLSSSETERRSALTLKSDLSQIAFDNAREELNSGQTGFKRSVTDQNYYTRDGRIVYLGALLGSGGEGAVYKVPNMPGKVVKIFKSSLDMAYMERKVEAIINKHVPSKLNNILINTIPETLLYDEADSFVGYIMPGVTTRFKLYDVSRESDSRKKYFPELDYKGLIIIAYNLSEAIYFMHEHDVVIGDLNPNNVIVNPDGTVCLIDIDSCDIVDRKTNEHFPCSVGLPEMLAPELQTVGNLKEARFTKESDVFSLAILIFRLLMRNADPFGGIFYDRTRSLSNVLGNKQIVNGECPFVKNIDGMKIPDWAQSIDILPNYIQDLFVRVFDYNADNIMARKEQRPTAKEWMDALTKFYNEPLKKCDRDSFHWFLKKFDECPFCSKDRSNMALKKSGIKEKKKRILESLNNIITVKI